MGSTRRIDGWSESLWKSLAVKSLRMGWPAGLEAAERALNPSTLRSLLTCGIFEDTFPATGEIEAVLEAVAAKYYERLGRLLPVQFREGASSLVPFMECALEIANEEQIEESEFTRGDLRLPISEIFVGPTPHSELARHSAQTLCEVHTCIRRFSCLGSLT